MEEHQNEALIQRVPSQETIVNRGRDSNGRALKVTGLTVLACLLLAGQGLTAYLVYGQKEHLSALSAGQEKLKADLTRKMSASPPKAMHLPMNSMSLLKDYPDESSDQTSSKKSRVPLTKLRPSFTNQREGSGQVDGARMMHLPMKSLPLLMDEEVKSTPETEVEVQNKCQLDSQKEVRPGFFKPQCDEQGNYLPKQCWHSTGYCWCVDKSGVEIPDTRTRQPLQCS